MRKKNEPFREDRWGTYYFVHFFPRQQRVTNPTLGDPPPQSPFQPTTLTRTKKKNHQHLNQRGPHALQRAHRRDLPLQEHHLPASQPYGRRRNFSYRRKRKAKTRPAFPDRKTHQGQLNTPKPQPTFKTFIT